LQVEHQLRNWPEKSARETRWCSVEDALARTNDPGLRRLIAKFAEASARRANALPLTPRRNCVSLLPRPHEVV
jgi:hypothetical protein